MIFAEYFARKFQKHSTKIFLYHFARILREYLIFFDSSQECYCNTYSKIKIIETLQKKIITYNIPKENYYDIPKKNYHNIPK